MKNCTKNIARDTHFICHASRLHALTIALLIHPSPNSVYTSSPEVTFHLSYCVRNKPGEKSRVKSISPRSNWFQSIGLTYFYISLYSCIYPRGNLTTPILMYSGHTTGIFLLFYLDGNWSDCKEFNCTQQRSLQLPTTEAEPLLATTVLQNGGRLQ